MADVHRVGEMSGDECLSESREESTDEEAEDVYEVEKIVGMCQTKGQALYKVRWAGYGPDHDTWEPYENLESCKDVIDKYIEDQKRRQPDYMEPVTDELDKEVFSQEGSTGSEISAVNEELDEEDDDAEPDEMELGADDASQMARRKKGSKSMWKYVSSSDDEADTLKDKFWRNLEQGKVDVFAAGDMYSKLKVTGRASRPTSFTKMYANKIPSQPPPGEKKEIKKGRGRKKRTLTEEKPDGRKARGKRKGRKTSLDSGMKDDDTSSVCTTLSDVTSTGSMPERRGRPKLAGSRSKKGAKSGGEFTPSESSCASLPDRRISSDSTSTSGSSYTLTEDRMRDVLMPRTAPTREESQDAVKLERTADKEDGGAPSPSAPELADVTMEGATNQSSPATHGPSDPKLLACRVVLRPLSTKDSPWNPSAQTSQTGQYGSLSSSLLADSRHHLGGLVAATDKFAVDTKEEATELDVPELQVVDIVSDVVVSDDELVVKESDMVVEVVGMAEVEVMMQTSQQPDVGLRCSGSAAQDAAVGVCPSDDASVLCLPVGEGSAGAEAVPHAETCGRGAPAVLGHPEDTQQKQPVSEHVARTVKTEQVLAPDDSGTRGASGVGVDPGPTRPFERDVWSSFCNIIASRADESSYSQPPDRSSKDNTAAASKRRRVEGDVESSQTDATRFRDSNSVVVQSTKESAVINHAKSTNANFSEAHTNKANGSVLQTTVSCGQVSDNSMSRSTAFKVTNYKALFSKHQDQCGVAMDTQNVAGNTVQRSPSDRSGMQGAGKQPADPISSLEAPINNNKGELFEEFDFDLVELDPLEWEGKIPKKRALPEVIDLTNAELRQAVKDNEYDKVCRALKGVKKYDLDQPDHLGVTLTMIAAQHGYDDLLELLVLRGGNVNAEQKNGTTALMMASEQGLRCTVCLLLAMCANMNAFNISGETALTKATRRGHYHVVKMLVENGANYAAPSGTDHNALKIAKQQNQRDLLELLTAHIARVTSEFERQVQITLNNTAKILGALFPMQCLALREHDKFKVIFKHELQPTRPGMGMLLFVAHARVASQEVKCRLYGPCAITAAVLNGVKLHPLTEEGNFVMSFSPLHNGRNELEIHAVRAPTSKAKLVVCAYQAQLV